MKDKLQKAIHNNNGLYEAIFSNHHMKFGKTDSIWYSLENAPPLYSNLVTISKNWRPDDIFRSIDLKCEREAWGQWSIKDSYAVLDLGEFGFTKLFDACWIYLEAANFRPAVDSRQLRFEIVNSEEALSAWRLTWDSEERLGKEIFDSKLFDNKRVYFIAGYKAEQIVNGCFVNKTDNVLGISNFFSPNEGVDHWSAIISFIFSSIEHSDLVGYERCEQADKLQSLGFESIGNLTVWLKKRSDTRRG